VSTGVEIAKPFIEATTTVLQTMAMLNPKAGKPFVKKDKAASGDVSAVIGFTGDKNGSISVSFSKKCAITMVKNLLGDAVEDLVQDTKDAVGEVCNMISGQARAGLSQMGMTFHGSTPTVIMGDGHTISHVSKGPVIAIPFTTEGGDFTLEFSFE
jgi:chemotaxis protein CheX